MTQRSGWLAAALLAPCLLATATVSGAAVEPRDATTPWTRAPVPAVADFTADTCPGPQSATVDVLSRDGNGRAPRASLPAAPGVAGESPRFAAGVAAGTTRGSEPCPGGRAGAVHELSWDGSQSFEGMAPPAPGRATREPSATRLATREPRTGFDTRGAEARNGPAKQHGGPRVPTGPAREEPTAHTGSWATHSAPGSTLVAKEENGHDDDRPAQRRGNGTPAGEEGTGSSDSGGKGEAPLAANPTPAPSSATGNGCGTEPRGVEVAATGTLSPAPVSHGDMAHGADTTLGVLACTPNPGTGAPGPAPVSCTPAPKPWQVNGGMTADPTAIGAGHHPPCATDAGSSGTRAHARGGPGGTAAPGGNAVHQFHRAELRALAWKDRARPGSIPSETLLAMTSLPATAAGKPAPLACDGEAAGPSHVPAWAEVRCARAIQGLAGGDVATGDRLDATDPAAHNARPTRSNPDGWR